MKQSRRDFIEKAVLASIGILFFSRCKHNPEEIKEKSKIIIVGAGISGLSAAYRLKKEGFDVLVLEASERIGGRINSADFGGIKVDLGASWIHGINNNLLYEYAKSKNISTIATKSEPSYIFDEFGDDVTEEEWNKWSNFLNKLVNESFKNDPNLSLKELIEKYWTEAALSPRLERVFKSGIRLELEIPYAEDTEKLAANVLRNDGYYPGKHVILRNGMSSIIDALSYDIDIRLNTFVTKVEYSQDKVIIHTTETKKVSPDRSCNACHANILTEEVISTYEYEAERVLITLPVTILKNEAVVFEPPLPKYKQDAINNIQHGLMDKVFLRYEKAFWKEGARFFSKLNDIQSDIFEFMNMRVIYNNKPILIAFFGARNAKRLELLDDNSLINYITDELKAMFGSDVPKPVEIIRTRWHQAPLSLGSYPVIPPGFKSELFVDMAKSVDNKLFFAGDATEKKYYASAHGAFNSGARAANEIINSF